MPNSSTNNKLSLGFIGLGSMGLPIAINLIQSGFNVKAYSRSYKKLSSSLLEEIKFCRSPKEVAESIDVLLICVSNDEATDEVLFGKNGASESLRSNNIVIDLSTISPDQARENSSRLSKIKVDYFDAPLTGGTEGAKNGTLSILLGGKKSLIQTILPILNSIGRSIKYFGEVGKGQEVKAVNQVIISGIFASLAEAISLGEALNLPMQEVINALSMGAADSWVLRNRSANMLTDAYPLGFKLDLHYKDLCIALKSANQKGINLPITQQIKELEERLINKGLGGLDMSAIKKSMEY